MRQISKMEKKIKKKLFLFAIIASQLLPLICSYEEQDTFHRQPMCKEAVPRFGISVRETFSNSINLAVINEYDKGHAKQI